MKELSYDIDMGIILTLAVRRSNSHFLFHESVTPRRHRSLVLPAQIPAHRVPADLTA
jgi:hypothetical protein